MMLDRILCAECVERFAEEHNQPQWNLIYSTWEIHDEIPCPHTPKDQRLSIKVERDAPPPWCVLAAEQAVGQGGAA